jgi:hypothetical protein
MTQVEAIPPTEELPVPALPAAPVARGRYRALAAAVRSHQLLRSHPSVPKRPADHALYRALQAQDSLIE